MLSAAWENWFVSLLAWLCDGYWPERRDELTACIRGARRVYALEQLLAVGNTADILLATSESVSTTAAIEQFLVKVSRVPEGATRLDNEREVLAKLSAAAGDSTYSKYLPRLVESFAVKGKFSNRVNVFSLESGFRTLEQVHEQQHALAGEHLAWIFNRLLTVLGFCRRQGIVHGAVFPCHVMIHAANHGLQLVGWGGGVSIGGRIRTVPSRYTDWYPPEVPNKRPVGPATDLFLVARCLVYLAGGDPLTNRMPESVPLPMRRFIATCLLESPRMRPDDAWALQEEFDGLLRSLYGPPKFHELTLT
jgi:serine/threonine protein kinase